MDRIVVEEKHLASALAVMLGRLPNSIIEQLVEHKILALYKRQNSAPRIEAAIGQHLAAELTKAKWEVSHAAPEGLGSPPPFSGRDFTPQ